MIFLVIAFFSAVIALYVPGLIRRRYWRELAVFGTLLSIGFIISLLMTLGIDLPYLSTSIGEMLTKTFHLK